MKTNLTSYDEKVLHICSGISSFVFDNKNNSLGLQTIKVYSKNDTILINRNGINENCDKKIQVTCEKQYKFWNLMNGAASICKFQPETEKFILDYARNIQPQCGFSQLIQAHLYDEEFDEITLNVLNELREEYKTLGEKLFCEIHEQEISKFKKR